MKTYRPVLASANVTTFIQITAQKQSTNSLQFFSSTGGYTDIGSTTSLVFETLHTSQYTIDYNGKLTPYNMYISMIVNNDVNGECKLQISGNKDSTWTDITDAIPGANSTYGSGLWIDNIVTGMNGLQLRILGRSTDGNAATIRIRGDSYLQLGINKKLI